MEVVYVGVFLLGTGVLFVLLFNLLLELFH
jgi:hypothetical protein